MQEDYLLRTHNFAFNNPQNDGKHSIILETKFYNDIDGFSQVYCYQKLTLYSNGNYSSFNFCRDIFNPDNLRKLADELEKEEKECILKLIQENSNA